MLGSQLEMSEVRRPRVWGGCGGRKVTDGGAPDPAEVLRELSRGGGDPAEVLRELPQGGGGAGQSRELVQGEEVAPVCSGAG